jgi:hypothetical protein
MLVTVTRNPLWSDDRATEGTLDIDGVFQCYTMENTQYLTPDGTYDLVWYPSPRWHQWVPQVMVPDRTNIEIHPANWPNQLDGCTAVGEQRIKDMVEQSDLAFIALKTKLQLPCKIVYIHSK